MTKQTQPTLAQKQNIIDRLADREYTATTTASAPTDYKVQWKITQSDLDELYDGDFQAWLQDCDSGELSDQEEWEFAGRDGAWDSFGSISVQTDQGDPVLHYYDGQVEEDYRDQND